MQQRATSGDLESCGILPKTLEIAGKPNEFDVSTYLSYDALLAPDSALSVYLNDARVQEAIHVRGKAFLPGVGTEDTTGELWLFCCFNQNKSERIFFTTLFFFLYESLLTFFPVVRLSSDDTMRPWHVLELN